MENNQKAKFDFVCEAFNAYINGKKFKNPSFYPTKTDIYDFLDDVFPKSYDIYVSNEEREPFSRKLESLYEVYQEEGSIIFDDYEHNDEWYKNKIQSNGFLNFYWNRYISYLKYPKAVKETLDIDTMNILSHLGDPNSDSPFSIRGLVIGDIQSGKTSNYLGLITKAADAGYKVFFILTGTIESLRKQTQQRVEEGFIGYDTTSGEDVGVKRCDKTPKSFTSREHDFTGTNDQNTTYKISNYSSEPMIFVLKKNVSVLKKVYSCLKKINTTSINPKIHFPALIIDDEADNASINTRDEDKDPTVINSYIRKLLSLFYQTSYIGFTATPFANVFINSTSTNEMLGDDLFPRNFIYALKPPSNYCGAKKYFSDDSDKIVYINDDDQSIFPMNHKKTWGGNRLYDSLYDAINTFFIANTIRDIRDIDKKTHRSMLINMSRFKDVQLQIKDIVKDYFDTVKKHLYNTQRSSLNIALTDKYIQSLKKSFDLHFFKESIAFKEVLKNMYSSIEQIKVVVVNSSKESEKLEYEKYSNIGLRVIAIGGLALSRGLTLEGLMTSYFYRNTHTFDVLMQMGRWFGYREGYEDLCKLFTTEETADHYSEIDEDIAVLKSDVDKMFKEKKKPSEYGIRVRNCSEDLKITANNKMRSGKIVLGTESFAGNVFETRYLPFNIEDEVHNKEVTETFLNKLDSNKRDSSIKNHQYFRNIQKEDIIDLLTDLKIHPANIFDVNQITTFLKLDKNTNIKFDLLLMGGDSDEIKYHNDHLNIDLPVAVRQYNFRNADFGKAIRLSGNHAHLMGSSDTRIGLNPFQLTALKTQNNAKDFMKTERNPLFIIYFLELNNKNKKSEELLEKNGFDFEKDEILFNTNMAKEEMNYVLGYAIAFPSVEDKDNYNVNYVVNTTANYYEQNHEEDDYGEE